MKKSLLLLLLVASTGIVSAYDFKVDGLCYNILTDQTNAVEVTYELHEDNSNYAGLTHTSIPDSVTYHGTTYNVTSIGNQAFKYCNSLTFVNIPNSVKNIGNLAFYGSDGLISVSLGNSVMSIGVGAFSCCRGLVSITIASGNTVYDSRDNCKAIIETATNTLIVGCKSTTIPNTVASIGNYAFQYCSELTSISIPNSVTSIGNYAFIKCSDLTSISIPNSVTTIGSFAFKGCGGLTSISIPNSMKKIADSAFKDCSGLTFITCEAFTPPALSSAVFTSVDTSIPLYVPSQSIELYQATEGWKKFTNIQAITETVIVPPELVGGAEALSELFSKTFVLPDGFLMNTFDIQIDCRVAVDGSYRITDAKMKSNYTMLTDNNLRIEDLYSSVYAWFDQYGKSVIWHPGTIQNKPDSMSAHVILRYSPLFFAQAGDTLYMNGQRTHHNGARGEEPVYIWLTYVRNRPNTPYYAFVRRDEHKLSLRYVDTITHQVFMVENYVIHRPDRIYKNGYQNFMTPDKHVRYRQFFERDSMRYAEEMDSIGRVNTKYSVYYIGRNSYPQIYQKEIFYPSGALQMRTYYSDFGETTERFREDGSKAVYKPSPDAQEQLQEYFQIHFSVPFVPKARVGINYLTIKVELRVNIDENGQMHVLNKSKNKSTWNYNYKTDVITGFEIDNIINNYYGPYYKEFINELLKQTFECEPATIDGVAIPSTMTVTIEYTFKPTKKSKK